MKKLLSLVLIVICLGTTFNARAQAFDQSSKMLTISLGPASMFHIPLGYNFYNSFYSPITGQLGVEGDFGIHKYVSLGFTAAIGGRAGGYTYTGLYGYGYGSGYYPEFNVAVGVMANFHFYQLIADKTGNEHLHADKLDIYAGLNVGSGVAIHPTYTDYYGKSSTALDALVFVGPQVGVHYFFKPNIAVNGEVGYGKTLVRAGITFKLNK